MKKSNKLVILSACIFVVTLAFVMSAFLRASTGGKTNEKGAQNTYENSEANSIEAESNISKPLSEKKDNISYVIKISDKKICAYMQNTNGDLVLWNSMDIPPTLSKEDKELLQKGIHTQSFEEMCLYFESYAS